MRLNFLSPTVVKFSLVPLALGLCLSASRTGRAQSDGGGSGAIVLHGCPDTYVVAGHSDGLTYQVCADIVFTPSGNINATLHGELFDPGTAPSQAVVARGWPCVYGDKTTYDSQIVITPSGNVTGYCRLHP
jgi:hypothetical protein